MRTLMSSIGILFFLSNQPVCFGASQGPGVFIDSGELWVKDMFGFKHQLSKTSKRVNQFWLSPSGNYVAYSFVHAQEPSRRPEGGGELMPFYGVGVIDIGKRALLLEFVPDKGGSLQGAWQKDRFVVFLSAAAPFLAFNAKTRKLSLASGDKGEGQ